VAQVHAPEVWALGHTGQEIVVANQDTGMRWTHNALKPHYRGWNGSSADHNYNWWDAIHSGGGSCGPNRQEPCDDDSHGTHTTGTAVGDDGSGNQIGVAPGAKWIGCRNMDQTNGTPQTYTECFQFFIAPTNLQGQNPDPTRRPHVMNNSWNCPPSEGCAHDTLKTIVENTQAAGIFVVASTGNLGPNCSTVQNPPAIYEATFSTGAVSGANALAGFSSRGPVTVDGSGRIKPNIVAPGVNVRSSVNSGDSAYSIYSGTSMASPHMVGVVALLWSARPDLVRNIAATKQLLSATANPSVTVSNGGLCGGVDHVPNNHFGWGLVDALAAVNPAPPPPPPPAPPPPPPTPSGPPPPPARCRVPRVVGLRLASAKQRIRSAHCSVGRVRRVRSRRAGRVLAQSPRAGIVKPRGFRVNLVVGRR
jgi:serine protease AprX